MVGALVDIGELAETEAPNLINLLTIFQLSDSIWSGNMGGMNLKNKKNRPKNHFGPVEGGAMRCRSQNPQNAHLVPILNVHIKF